MHDKNVILTVNVFLLEGRSSLQVCVELIINNLEDFLLYDCFDSSIEGRCSVDKPRKPDLDKCHLLVQGGWKWDTLLYLYLCIVKLYKFLLIQWSLIVWAVWEDLPLHKNLSGAGCSLHFAVFQWNYFINLITSICVLLRKSQPNINFYSGSL